MRVVCMPLINCTQMFYNVHRCQKKKSAECTIRHIKGRIPVIIYFFTKKLLNSHTVKVLYFFIRLKYKRVIKFLSLEEATTMQITYIYNIYNIYLQMSWNTELFVPICPLIYLNIFLSWSPSFSSKFYCKILQRQ